MSNRKLSIQETKDGTQKRHSRNRTVSGYRLRKSLGPGKSFKTLATCATYPETPVSLMLRNPPAIPQAIKLLCHVEEVNFDDIEISRNSLCELDKETNEPTTLVPSKEAISLHVDQESEIKQDEMHTPKSITARTSQLSPSTSTPSPKTLSAADSWTPDELAPECYICEKQFSSIRRRHHCRACGHVVCATCSKHKARLQGAGSKVLRVCESCIKHIQPKDCFEKEGNFDDSDADSDDEFVKRTQSAPSNADKEEQKTQGKVAGLLALFSGRRGTTSAMRRINSVGSSNSLWERAGSFMVKQKGNTANLDSKQNIDTRNSADLASPVMHKIQEVSGRIENEEEDLVQDVTQEPGKKSGSFDLLDTKEMLSLKSQSKRFTGSVERRISDQSSMSLRSEIVEAMIGSIRSDSITSHMESNIEAEALEESDGNATEVDDYSSTEEIDENFTDEPSEASHTLHKEQEGDEEDDEEDEDDEDDEEINQDNVEEYTLNFKPGKSMATVVNTGFTGKEWASKRRASVEHQEKIEAGEDKDARAHGCNTDVKKWVPEEPQDLESMSNRSLDNGITEGSQEDESEEIDESRDKLTSLPFDSRIGTSNRDSTDSFNTPYRLRVSDLVASFNRKSSDLSVSVKVEPAGTRRSVLRHSTTVPSVSSEVLLSDPALESTWNEVKSGHNGMNWCLFGYGLGSQGKNKTRVFFFFSKAFCFVLYPLSLF